MSKAWQSINGCGVNFQENLIQTYTFIHLGVEACIGRNRERQSKAGLQCATSRCNKVECDDVIDVSLHAFLLKYRQQFSISKAANLKTDL